jgi:hypothetical protein
MELSYQRKHGLSLDVSKLLRITKTCKTIEIMMTSARQHPILDFKGANNHKSLQKIGIVMPSVRQHLIQSNDDVLNLQKIGMELPSKRQTFVGCLRIALHEVLPPCFSFFPLSSLLMKVFLNPHQDITKLLCLIYFTHFHALMPLWLH